MLLFFILRWLTYNAWVRWKLYSIGKSSSRLLFLPLLILANICGQRLLLPLPLIPLLPFSTLRHTFLYFFSVIINNFLVIFNSIIIILDVGCVTFKNFLLFASEEFVVFNLFERVFQVGDLPVDIIWYLKWIFGLSLEINMTLQVINIPHRRPLQQVNFQILWIINFCIHNLENCVIIYVWGVFFYYI